MRKTLYTIGIFCLFSCSENSPKTISSINQTSMRDSEISQSGNEIKYGESKAKLVSNFEVLDKKETSKAELLVQNVAGSSQKLAYKPGEQVDYLFEQIKTKHEIFSVDITNGAQFTCKGGTIITIPKNTITDKDGRVVEGVVEFKVTEMNKVSDLIRSRVSTRSDNEILETGGTVNIIATKDNKELAVAEDKSIKLQFPIQGQQRRNMIAFYGDVTKKAVNWSETVSFDGSKKILIDKTKIYYKKNDGLYLHNHQQLEVDFKRQMNKVLNLDEVDGSTDVSYTVLSNGSIIKIDFENNSFDHKTTEAIKSYFEHSEYASSKGIGKNPFAMRIKHHIETSNKSVNYDVVNYELSYENVEKHSTKEPFDYKKREDVALVNGRPYYNIEAQSFGMINCDRYSRDIRPRTNMIVVCNKHKNAESFLIIPEQRGILAAALYENKAVFRQIPQGENGILLSLNYVDGKIFYAMKNIKFGRKKIESQILKEVTEDELYAELEKIDKSFFKPRLINAQTTASL